MQCVSVPRAGVVCSLQARTTILAAANPTGSHYNRAKTVAENLKIGPTFLFADYVEESGGIWLGGRD